MFSISRIFLSISCLSTGGSEGVNFLAEFFESTYSSQTDDFPVYSEELNIEQGTHFTNITILPDELLTELLALKESKCTGPDGIPALFMKNCAYVLYKPLCDILNKSLKECIFPDIWKASYITPIHKSGSKSDVTNYRPISILSAIPKLFEVIISKKIKTYINSMIIKEQHGFVNGKSTLTNLLLFSQDIYENLELGYQIDAIYTDFSKAFDKVSISLLIKKLRNFGFDELIIKWFYSYLINRKQIVKYKSFLSREIKVTSGVPQGSHLGPILFTVYINDIKHSLGNSQFLLFADDCKIYRIVREINDCINLQEDLDNLSTWCSHNGMFLNVNKCQIISFNRSRSLIEYPYVLSDTILNRVTQVKDLGVIFDTKVSFNQHIDYIVSKSMRMLGFLKRNGNDFRNLSTIVILYNALVKPILLYCSPVWAPHFETHIKRLERVQHKFLSYAAFKAGIANPSMSHDYSEIAVKTGLSTLQSFRQYNDACVLYKIMNDLFLCPELSSLLILNEPTRVLRTHRLFEIPLHKSSYGFHSPMSRIMRLGNSASCPNLYIPSLAIFKNCAKSIYLKEFH